MRLPIGNINIVKNAILKHNWNEETLGQAVATFKNMSQSDQDKIWYAIQNGGYNAMNHYKIDQGTWDDMYQPLVNAYVAAQNGNISSSNVSTPTTTHTAGMATNVYQNVAPTTGQLTPAIMTDAYNAYASGQVKDVASFQNYIKAKGYDEDTANQLGAIFNNLSSQQAGTAANVVNPQTNASIPSNLKLTGNGTVDTALVNMIASDPSAQGTFRYIKGLPTNLQEAAIKDLSPEMKLAYASWNQQQDANASASNETNSGTTTTDGTGSNNSNNGSDSTNNQSTSTSSSSTTTSSYTPVGSSTSSTSSLTLNNDTIRDIIGRLNQCVEELENIIKSIETGELTTINNSWVASEAQTYTNKLVNSNTKMRKVNEGLRLLSSAYNQALNEAQSTSSAVSSAINNI